MGYILPVNDYQSVQYANRLRDDSHYAKISQLQRVNQVASFMEKFEEERAERRGELPRLVSARSVNEVQGYIHPNPANLSPAIAEVVGKGRAINAYV